MSTALVSVVVPTRDGERWVAEAVASALAQSHAELEVVVCDDGSRDTTLERVAAFDDGRLRVLPSAGAPQGAAANWNRGLAAARGRYVKVLCQDDRLLPGALEAQVRALEADRALVLAGSARRIVDAAGRVLLRRVGAAPTDVRADRRQVLQRCLERGSNVVGEPSAVLADRAALLRAGGFRPAGYVTDLEAWLRLLHEGGAVLLARAGADFRVHDASWSASLRREQAAATRTLLHQTAAAAGLPAGRGLGPRTTGRRLGRSVVYGVSRLTAPTPARSVA